ncbi:hypothetical protein J6590_006254 [Homalodisca vitripennis]|nr:hypothetical protein J6590_006254 [Homalodisca vitripennis]
MHTCVFASSVHAAGKLRMTAGGLAVVTTSSYVFLDAHYTAPRIILRRASNCVAIKCNCFPRRVTASARYTAPRYDATPLLREQSVTFIAPRNTMETIASSAKSALEDDVFVKFSEEEDEL